MSPNAVQEPNRTAPDASGAGVTGLLVVLC
jgi:hypothetical protein